MTDGHLPPRPVLPGRPTHIQSAITEARNRADEIRSRVAVIARILELIPPAIAQGKVSLIHGSGGTWHLRTDKGQNLGQLNDRSLAQFILDAPDHLKALSGYIGHLEQKAFDTRQDRRDDVQRQAQRDNLLRQITDELLAADGLGVHTKDGQRRVRSAISAAKREDEDRRSW